MAKSVTEEGDRRIGRCVLTSVVLVVSRCGPSGGHLPEGIVDVAVNAGDRAVSGRFPRIDCHIDDPLREVAPRTSAS